MAVYGPYRHGKRWRVLEIVSGDRRSKVFRSFEDAVAHKDTLVVDVPSLTVTKLLEDFKAAPRVPNRPTFLYSLHGKTGNLVYVGITGNPTYRFEAHRATKDFAFARMQGPMVRELAEEAERRLIRRYRPKYNTTHKPDEPGFTWEGRFRNV